MRLFHAPLFAQTIQLLQIFQDNCDFSTRAGGGAAHVSASQIDLLLKTAEDARAFCERYLLPTSAEKIKLSLMHFNHDRAALSFTAAGVEVRNIIESIMTEAHGIWLLQVEPDRVERLRRSLNPFGAAVEAAFPSAVADIQSSAMCLVTELNTAAVFHLMRAAEFGLRALAEDRGIKLEKDKPIKLATWEDLIRKLEVEEANIQQFPKTLVREEQFAFYHGAMMELRRFKNKFRNGVMHSRDRYDRDEANSAFTHVKAFMEILASKIAEGTTTPRIWV
jgi:hypothetical protein